MAVAMRMTGPSSPAPCGIWPSPWVHAFQRRTPRHVLPCTPAAGDSARAGQCAHTRVLLVVACGLRECVETEPCCGERRGRRGWRPASGRCHVSTGRSRPPGWRPLGLGGGEGPRRTGRRCHPAAPHAASSGAVVAQLQRRHAQWRNSSGGKEPQAEAGLGVPEGQGAALAPGPELMSRQWSGALVCRYLQVKERIFGDLLGGISRPTWLGVLAARWPFPGGRAGAGPSRGLRLRGHHPPEPTPPPLPSSLDLLPSPFCPPLLPSSPPPTFPLPCPPSALFPSHLSF